jgi:hypothetical protein
MRATVGIAILTFLPLFAALVESRACIGHFLERRWPPHATFHVMMGLAGLLGAYGLILTLVWIPLRRGERWAWFAIALAALVVHGGAIISDLVTDGGLRKHAGIVASGSKLFAGIFVSLALYAVGLALTWLSTRPG